MTAIVALRMPQNEADFLQKKVANSIAIGVGLPALWILVQILPVAGVGLAHPIWNSAAEALRRPIAASISVDPGLTMIALTQVFCVGAVVFVAAALSINRKRAEWILFALAAATTIVALGVVVTKFWQIKLLAALVDHTTTENAAIEISGLGVILTTGAALQAVQAGKTRGAAPAQPRGWNLFFFAASLAAAAICLTALIVSAAAEAFFAVVGGLLLLIIAIAIRYFAIGRWGISAIASVILLIVVAAVVDFQPEIKKAGLTLAFASNVQPGLVALTERVLSDSFWTGTGAGTFSAMLPLYQEINEMALATVAPTAAAKIAVEMGEPFMWVVSIGAVFLAILLLRGALRRHRDPFFSMVGASCVVTITLMAFADAAVFSTPVLIVAAVATGMALAQRQSPLSR